MKKEMKGLFLKIFKSLNRKKNVFYKLKLNQINIRGGIKIKLI